MTDPNPTLSSGALSLILSPGMGGSIARFDYRSPAGAQIPVFRGLDAADPTILDHANFPLVPFVNRVRDGRFVFRGREVRLSANLPGDASPLHGQGWTSRWTLARLGHADAELVFRHAAGEWPWAYEARQHLALDPRGLAMEIACTNLSGEPMPCGLGHHPYFPCTPETVLDTGVESAWTIDDKVLPVDKVPALGRYDLRERRICGPALDNGFGGWSGVARMHTPGQPFRIELSSPDAHFFQIYSPASGGFYVAEPVTHANAALNEPEERWPELGLRVLEPGETMRVAMRIEVIPV
jgi:aldose 1-epimerase